MSLLSEEIKRELKRELEGLKNEAKLIVFTQELECQYCKENHILAEDIASLTDKIKLEVYNFTLDKNKVEEYKVDKIPAMVVCDGTGKDYGIRFYGIPAGYEFTSLIEAIRNVSTGESGLTEKSKEELKKLTQPAHIQVFVTLTWPYCTQAVSLAHRLALESDLIKADMVEAGEFPHLSHKYDVFAVPKVIINEKYSFEGALPEESFIAEVLKASEF